MRSLIVEDDKDLRSALSDAMRQVGHEVDEFADGRQALSALLTREYDLAIVDLALPKMDGIALVQAVRRQRRNLPILIVTARDAVSERITGLDAGADDYLVKPFQLPEFEARVRALLRRQHMNRGEPFKIGELTFTPGQPRLTLGERTIELSTNEYALFELLTNRIGKLVGKSVIADRLAKGDEPLSDTAIELCVHRLRRKLATTALKIRALRGFGYLLEVADEERT